MFAAQTTNSSRACSIGFKKRFEITFAKALRAFALNNLEKQRRPIFYRFGEDLEQITFVVAIDQNPEML